MSSSSSSAEAESINWTQIPHEQLLELFEELSKPPHVKFIANSGVEHPIPFTPCVIWKKGFDQSGYGTFPVDMNRFLPQPTGRKVNRVVRMHQLALYSRIAQFSTARMHASHLCHRPACINPDHLVLETPTQNNLRNQCMHHAVTPSGEIIVVCPHLPKCLRRDPNVGTFEPYVFNAATRAAQHHPAALINNSVIELD